MRIVSLLPSATEIVYSLGLGEDLLGVTFECDHPTDARTKRVVSSSVLSGLDDPGEIDAAVRRATADGGLLYRIDAEAVAAIDPDLILTQDLCRVCAVPSGDVDEALDRLGCRAEVVSLDPTSLDEVLADIERVAERAGVPERGREVVSGLRDRLASVDAAVAGRTRRTVAVLEWVDPPFRSGHWVPDLVERAGGREVLAEPGGHSTTATWPELAAADPEVVVVSPCGYHLDAVLGQAETVAGRPELEGRELWAIDADGIVVRPGPRLVEGVEALAWALHPDAVREPPPGHIQRLFGR